MVARAGFLADLGLEPTAHPHGAGEYIAADATGLTAVPGLWVAGNVTDLFAQVGGGCRSGGRRRGSDQPGPGHRRGTGGSRRLLRAVFG
jgi:hypothetical protein